jgi:hypothetical protein
LVMLHCIAASILADSLPLLHRTTNSNPSMPYSSTVTGPRFGFVTTCSLTTPAGP